LRCCRSPPPEAVQTLPRQKGRAADQMRHRQNHASPKLATQTVFVFPWEEGIVAPTNYSTRSDRASDPRAVCLLHPRRVCNLKEPTDKQDSKVRSSGQS